MLGLAGRSLLSKMLARQACSSGGSCATSTTCSKSVLNQNNMDLQFVSSGALLDPAKALASQLPEFSAAAFRLCQAPPPAKVGRQWFVVR